jgi:uncharacterized SAM-binding protein YcdF (DUF218 family)
MGSLARALRWIAAATLVGLLVGLVAIWPRDDAPQEPDAIVVLGGVGIDRARLGIELHEEHGGVLVLSSSAWFFGDRLGVACSREALCIEPSPKTTAGEARTVADLAARQRWEHVTVVTSRHHTTRSRVLFRQCLGERVSVVGSRRPTATLSTVLTRYAREAAATVVAVTIGRAC